MAGNLVLNEGSLFVKKEVTEGTYIAEASGNDAVEVIEGLELSPSREFLERANRTGTIESVSGKVGMKSMSATIPVELKSGASEGALPETAPFYEGLLGFQETQTATTTKTGNTSSQLEIEDADISKFSVGQIVLIKESGAFHVSPISAVDSTVGFANITLLIPAGSAFSDNVVISAFSHYKHGNQAPTLSITEYRGGKVRETAMGMRSTSCEISNFATGQIPQASFSLEGLDYSREVGTPLFSPIYDSETGADVPLVLNAKVFKGANELQLNELTLTMTNEISFKTATADPAGKIGSRFTKFSISGSINPYMSETDVDQFNDFNNNESFSLFAYASNPSATAGEFSGVVAFYLPNCKVTELAVGDQEGLLTDQISFGAYRSNGGDSVHLGFI